MNLSDSFEIKEILKELNITQKELSRMLNVNIRTVGRWVECPSKISGPARESLKAWRLLNRLGLSWGPEHVDIGIKDSEIKNIIRGEIM